MAAAEGVPCPARDGFLFLHNSFARGKEPDQLWTAELAQSVEGPTTGVRADLNQVEIYPVRVLLGEPIQQLKKLQLVKQIMLKPEHDVCVLSKIFQCLVAGGKLGTNLLVVAPPEPGQRLRANVRELIQRFGLRYGAVIKDILPGKVASRQPDLPESAGDGLTVRDVQHQKSLSRLLFCPGRELLFKLPDLRIYDKPTVGLVRIVVVIPLVIFLRDVKIGRWLQRRDNRIRKCLLGRH